jgi:PAS domain S-box-containing protein
MSIDPNEPHAVNENLKEHRTTPFLASEVARYWLSAIIDSADDAIISKTLEGIITSWNTGAERIFGYTADEVIGKPVTILIPADHLDEEPEILRRIRADERVEHYETVRVRKDGTEIDISLTVSPIKASDGTIIGASKIARDISERKRAEKSFAEQSSIIEAINRMGQTLAAELDLHKLVQNVTDVATGICEARFGSFFYNVVNEAGESHMLYAFSGFLPEIFSQFPIPCSTDILAPTLRGQGTLLLNDVKKDPRYGKNSPYYGMPKEHLVTSYLAVPVVSRSGEVYGGLFFGHPAVSFFTERSARIIEGLAGQAAVAMDNARLYEASQRTAHENEQLYRKAQEASQLKEEFLATISHELRTPLNAVLGWARMLRSGKLQEDEVAKALETIERNASAQAQLIDDLLDVSRIITGKLRLDVRPVDPSLCIEAAMDSVMPSAQAKGIRMQKLIDAGVVSVPGDQTRLQQIVWNLLSNAIKFTPRGGRVQVNLERAKSHVEISVSDTGQGIESEFLPHVFDRFRQADQRTARGHGGLGLGLAIVKQLVELHGGSVSASSGGKNKGSRFTVSLPIVPVYQVDLDGGRVYPVQRELLPSTEIEDRLDGISILVVDDEADTRHLLKRGLEDCGAQVMVAESAAEASLVIQREVPDLLISDIGMPEEDGYEMMRKLRLLPAENGGKIPAIALTAYARVKDRLRALRSGYQMHVPKPVELAELVAVAYSLVKRSTL